tara:strand:- start:493 stop:1050 length:558 start_codon:yes stop_codon:yes gene_type:complete
MEEILIKNINNTLKGRSIFLIGMMACGKSATGPELAQMLKYKFVDLDLLIEKVANKSISNIFKNDGENIFREYETKCLNEIIKFPSLVISTGGGVVTKKQNWGILRQGVTVWIDIADEIAIERLEKDINNRPLLIDQDIEKKYIDILNSRKSLYSQADLRISVLNESVEKVAEKIIIEIKKKIID